jgi:hypothetical protein
MEAGPPSPLAPADIDDTEWMSLDDASSLLESSGSFELPSVDSGTVSPGKLMPLGDAGSPMRAFGAPEPSGGKPAVAWSVDPFPGSSAQVKAEPASYSAMTVLDVESIKQRAAADFLSKADVAAVLANVERLGTPISTQPVRDPPSGTLVFYNKKNTKRFRDDGYQWRKKKDGRQVQEYHEKLKIGGVVVLTVCYTRLASDPDFQRRVYWLVDKERSHWVLVHYLRKRSAPAAAAATATATATTMAAQHQTIQLGPTVGSAAGGATSEAEMETSAPPMGTPVDATVHTTAHPAAPSAPTSTAAAPPVQEATGADILVSGEHSGIQLVDCSPDWGYVEGGQKVIIVYDVAQALATENAAAEGWEHSCVFGDVRVPAQVIRPGVARCDAPRAPYDMPGVVPLQLQLHQLVHAQGSAAGDAAAPGTMLATSAAAEFTYRRRPGLMSDSRLISAADEKEFYLRLMRTIGSVTGAMQPQPAPEQQHQQQQQQKTLTHSHTAIRNPSTGSDYGHFAVSKEDDGTGMMTDDESEHSMAAATEAAALAQGAEKEQARSAALALMVNLVELVTNAAADSSGDGSGSVGSGGSTMHQPALAALAAADNDGLTLLHYAAALGFVEVVGLLLARGVVEPNAADNEGCTAMHWASAHGREPVVALLLKAGASQLKNHDGLTPLGETPRPPARPPRCSLSGRRVTLCLLSV